MGKSQKPSIIHTIGVSGVIRLAYRLVKLSKKWYQWQIVSGESIVTHKTENFPYCTIAANGYLFLRIREAKMSIQTFLNRVPWYSTVEVLK